MNKDYTFEFQNRNQISNLNQLKLNNIFNNKSEKKNN